MSEDDESRPPQRAGTALPTGGGLFGAFGATAAAKAKARYVEAENKLGAALVEHQKLLAQLEDAKGAVARAVARNSDLDSIRLNAQMEVREQLEATEARLLELDVKKQKLGAEVAEIISQHRANVASNEAAELEAEARKLKAENDKLRAQIDQINLQTKLQRLQSTSARDKDLLDLQDRLAECETKLAELRQREQEFNNPALDEDESAGLKLKQIRKQIKTLVAEIASIQAQIDELDS